MCHVQAAARDTTHPRAARGAEDIDWDCFCGDGSLDVRNGDVGDGDTVRRSARRGSVLVVLLNYDAVLCNVRKGDVGVCDVGHAAGRSGNGFDAHAIVAW